MNLWTALLLGLAGSLHCAGMCGPLLCALPVVGEGRASFYAGRFLYNLGRISMYCLLGLGFGALGKTLSIAGLQRWLSLAAGCAVLIGLLASAQWSMNAPVWKAVALLKKAFARLLQRRSYRGLLALGALNGLLPCGLVYVASAGAAASGELWQGALYMLAFGAGTLPMMLGIGLVSPKLRLLFGQRGRVLIPVSVAMVGLLLVVRGLSLGIPYLSPDMADGHARCPACH
ncbi:MAG: rane protein [Verrucomicrobiales bacterium]|nr:rane protein [Verrucomicrobiales bacterium]